jgi:hypothetical protein
MCGVHGKGNWYFSRALVVADRVLCRTKAPGVQDPKGTFKRVSAQTGKTGKPMGGTLK